MILIIKIKNSLPKDITYIPDQFKKSYEILKLSVSNWLLRMDLQIHVAL